MTASERLTFETELGISIDKNEDCPTMSICWNCDIKVKDCKYFNDVVEKLAKYEAIGAIEEFKALKEKNEPKKPIYSDFDDNGNDEIIPYKAVCPVCEYEFEFGSWNEEENHHCICGQAMDWE